MGTVNKMDYKSVDEHREEVIKLLNKLNERQLTIFKHMARVDNHLEKLNGKVAEHELKLMEIKTWGGVAIFAMPILINIIMRVM